MKSVQKPNKFVVKETILVILNNYLLVAQQRSSAAVFRIITRWEGRARSGEQIGVVGDTIRCGGGWKDESFRQKIRDKIYR